MESIRRYWGPVSLLFGLSLVLATPADAQRSGFVVGFGLGPGYYSLSESGTSESKAALGVDFHIGGALGSGLEIYFFEKLMMSGSDDPGVDLEGPGVAGLGVAFPVSPKADIHGGIGTGVWGMSTSVTAGSTTVSETSVETNGLGLVAGGRYKLNADGRWMLNLDILYLAEPFDGFDASVFGVQLTINIMSH